MIDRPDGQLCIESTARFAAELDSDVTVREATAGARKVAAMHAAHVLNGSTYAHEIVARRPM